MMKRAEGLGVIHPVDDEGELPPDDTKEKNPGADSPAGRNVMRFDEKSSIRYGGDPGAALQGSLFSVEKEADGPDLGNLDIEALEKLVSTCRRCPLSEGRNKAVFGSGPPDARIVFIGEAPGKDEDLQGVPFVGRAGKLLTKILAAVGLSRDEVYITNILKCRPPNNRDPNEEESRACEPYLRRQLELINPALICALGRVAGQNLLKSKLSLSVLRRGSHYYDDI
ncbi:MAG: uracil-DNA glycosylase, partial [Candidatus Krumholzibacteria bacterium]|nr:uracil-DNA glycosylase [Candidatus Krumholzibacteria bacterium]